MSDMAPISEAFATGDQIAPIVDSIEAALEGVPRTHALIALTSIILLLQHPDISTDQIYLGVRDISRFVCMWLAGTEDEANGPTEPMDPSKMN